MKISKIAAATARRLYGLCQVNGQLDDNKLRDLVSKLIAAKPRDFQAILASIQRLTRLEQARRAVVVESATALNDAERQKVVAGLTKDYGAKLTIEYKIKPELLGGLRIKVGDDVLDGSVQGRIDRLSKAF
ncbi:MAG: ATP synthase F1 subunit delta [Akkermansiaceae bacterium]|jgi:F-type H+-transporting ATPase subunit delta|nr:ATP synthase F1 subunit delta [Luteolibacter sp.]